MQLINTHIDTVVAQIKKISSLARMRDGLIKDGMVKAAVHVEAARVLVEKEVFEDAPQTHEQKAK